MWTSSNNLLCRRRFVSRFIQAFAVMPLVAMSWGCEKKGGKEDTAAEHEPASCRDLTGVSKENLAIREKLGYVNESPIPDNQCANCNLYLPPANGKKCGGCMLFKGPVEANGYCTYWAPKV